MKQLPPALSRCDIPGSFSPSHLAFAERCLLRAVLGSRKGVPALNSHPAAAIGNVFHKLLELAVRGEVQHVGTPVEDAEATLDELLEREQRRLTRVWPPPVPELREVFPPLVWKRKRRVILDLAVAYLSGSLPRLRSSDSLGGGLNARELPPIGVWSEVKLETRELRLAGRADLIERTAEAVVIRDLKTGRVVDYEGEVLPHIELQLRLYGLMAHCVWPKANVELIVDDGTERTVPFATEDENVVLHWLTAAMNRLPEGTEDAYGLGTPGGVCEGCAFRHVCPSYRTAAPQSWNSDVSERMPLDIWGEVTHIAPSPNDRCDVTLLDAANRLVKIFGLSSARVDCLRRGDYFWCFGLRTRDRRRAGDGWRHPRNFFETAEDDLSVHAWTLETFVGLPS